MAAVICKSGIQQIGSKMVEKQKQQHKLGKKVGYYRFNHFLFHHAG